MAEAYRRQFEIVVVGAGPAGLAAAVSAADCGAQICMLDDNADLGGQIWRAEAKFANGDAAKWVGRLRAAGVEIFCGNQVVHHDVKSRTLFAEGPDGPSAIGFSKLILATGARELLLPFPGWTLPNVMAAGGLQAMAKSGLPIAGKRVVVAGTGPLLLAVAAYLRKHAAEVLAICEQASARALAGFAMDLRRQPDKIKQAFGLRRELRGVPFWPNTWPVRAVGRERIEKVIVSRKGQEHEMACDFLACGFHLVANTELSSLLGCRIRGGFVEVDSLQQTSIPDVYCAGEATGIGGLEISLIEGQIAGMAAAGQAVGTRGLRRQWEKSQGFVAGLDRTFKLRPELKGLADGSTIVCRCEDVTHARAARHTSWRDAKNQTRCGMGACQGRVCGPATQFLYGWNPESVRPPIFPVTLGKLAEITGEYQ